MEKNDFQKTFFSHKIFFEEKMIILKKTKKSEKIENFQFW